jgi:hypothetical protein
MNFKKLRASHWLQLFIIYLRYLVGGGFVFASVIKIKGLRFTTESGADYPIDSAWHYFETMYQSGLYWKFIGVAQLLAGLCLMTQRFSLLGATIFLPIIVNIFVITLSYYFAFTPVITGLMVLSNLTLLAWDWGKLKVVFNLAPEPIEKVRMENWRLWEITGLLLFSFTLGYRLIYDFYNLFVWFAVCMAIAFTSLIIGLRKRKQLAV